MSDDTAHPHDQEAVDLTRNQSLVLGVLQQTHGPLSAYAILDELRDHGLRAPLQIYRALDKLVEYGRVHRLESLNAFVACSHPGCEDHGTIAFAICESCRQVVEITDHRLAGQLQLLAGEAGLRLNTSVVELRGRCAQCAAA
ncbi:MAG: transcriptional repressor [Nitratireductor sp.]|nr:transcriptional repressor [Nitratireductor sp.]